MKADETWPFALALPAVPFSGFAASATFPTACPPFTTALASARPVAGATFFGTGFAAGGVCARAA